ncbi:MAG: hypothetical protein EOM12_09420, partial [Verrucomicrobiae bacterium]|nr:hypothetical protein [Verrucomicrobiae bacterium]
MSQADAQGALRAVRGRSVAALRVCLSPVGQLLGEPAVEASRSSACRRVFREQFLSDREGKSAHTKKLFERLEGHIGHDINSLDAVKRVRADEDESQVFAEGVYSIRYLLREKGAPCES